MNNPVSSEEADAQDKAAERNAELLADAYYDSSVLLRGKRKFLEAAKDIYDQSGKTQQ